MGTLLHLNHQENRWDFQTVPIVVVIPPQKWKTNSLYLIDMMMMKMKNLSPCMVQPNSSVCIRGGGGG